jgi:ABC-type multidrug transport system ATPase subunit
MKVSFILKINKLGIIFECSKSRCPIILDFFKGGDLTMGVIYMMIDTFIYFLLSILLFNRQRILDSIRNLLNCFGKKKIEFALEYENQDVKSEREIVQEVESTKENIILKNLSKSYNKEIYVLKNISMLIEKGKMFGLLGQNGAGKTSMIKILCGLLKPNSGELFINGVHLKEFHSKLNIGYCPQHPILFDNLSVTGHLLFYSRLKGVPSSQEKEHISEILKLVKLESLSVNYLAKDLSGGMKQRLSLGIALTGNPSSLILDEPTSSLDPVSKIEMWKILQNIKHEKCVLFSTHSLEEADILCDKIAIISKGELKCIGSPSFLKKTYGSGYHLMVEFPVEFENSVVEFIEDLIPKSLIIRRYLGRLVFGILKQSDFNLSKFVHLMESESQNRQILYWSISDTTLEDVFMNIVQK